LSLDAARKAPPNSFPLDVARMLLLIHCL